MLLRPLAIRRYGRDFELKLKGQPFLNPALARELREQFQITLDAEAFVALAITNGVFKPQPVIDRLQRPHHAPAVVPRRTAPRGLLLRRGRPGDGGGCRAPRPSPHRCDRRQPRGTRRARRAWRAGPAGRAGRTPALHRHPPPRRGSRAGAGRRRDRIRIIARREDPARNGRDPDDRERDRRARREGQAGARRRRAPGEPRRHRPPPRPGRPRRSRCHDRRAPARPHPIDLAQREGGAAPGRRRRRRARTAPQGAARLPFGAHPTRPRAPRLGARRARRAGTPRPGPRCTVDDCQARPRVARRARRRARPRRARPRTCSRARRVPLRAGRFALVRRIVHLVRRGEPRTRTRQATERHRAAAAAGAGPRADLADEAPPVRVGRRARGLPSAPPRRARDPRPVPAVGVRPAARRAHRRHLGPARLARHVGCQPPAPAPPRARVRPPGRARDRPERGAARHPAAAHALAAVLRGGSDPRRPGRHRRRPRRVPNGRDGPRRARRTARRGRDPAPARRPTRSRARHGARRPRCRIRGAHQPAGAHRRARHGSATSTSIRCSSISRNGTCPSRRWPASSSSPGGSPCSSRCSRATRRLLGANTTVLDRLEADFRLVDEAHASAAGAQLAWHLAENWKVALVDHPDEADATEADAPRRPRAPGAAASRHPEPLPRPRAGLARLALRRTRDRRRHRVRRRRARRRRIHDDRREPRRHPARASRSSRSATPSRRRRRSSRPASTTPTSDRAPARPSTASTHCTPTRHSPGSASSCPHSRSPAAIVQAARTSPSS